MRPEPEGLLRQELEGLLRQASSGDKNALRQLLVAILPCLREKVRRRLINGCRDSGDDVLQSAIRRVLDHPIPEALTLDRFLAWVGTIIRNRCHDEGREHVRKPATLDEPNWVPGRDAGAMEQRAPLVWSALQLLKESYRRVLEYAYYDRLACREIGEHMKLSEGAVRILKHRALEALGKLLENCHDDQ
jgi:RNA polymerase sigma factor (sigma-70 family)